MAGTKAAKLTWTRRSDGLKRYYEPGVIVASDVCRGDGWNVVAVCRSTPSAVNGAKNTNRAAWTCAGNGSSYNLAMGWYTSLNSSPRAADVCRGVTCTASSWECHQPSSYFSSSSLSKPANVVGTKTSSPCCECSLTFTDPGDICDGETETETKTCPTGEYLCDGSTSETRTITGTKTTGLCAPEEEDTVWSAGQFVGSHVFAPGFFPLDSEIEAQAPSGWVPGLAAPGFACSPQGATAGGYDADVNTVTVDVHGGVSLEQQTTVTYYVFTCI